jgi:hypothetical protein
MSREADKSVEPAQRPKAALDALRQRPIDCRGPLLLARSINPLSQMVACPHRFEIASREGDRLCLTFQRGAKS